MFRQSTSMICRFEAAASSAAPTWDPDRAERVRALAAALRERRDLLVKQSAWTAASGWLSLAAAADDFLATWYATGRPRATRARDILQLFARVRAEMLGSNTLFYQPGPAAVAKAEELVAQFSPEDHACAENVLRLACERVRRGAPGWTDARLRDPAFLWGVIVSKWTWLREELLNKKADAEESRRALAERKKEYVPPTPEQAEEMRRDLQQLLARMASKEA